MHAQDSKSDKKNKIIAQCKSVLDGMSVVLSFGAGLLKAGCTQMEPDGVFWDSWSSFLSTGRNQKGCEC